MTVIRNNSISGINSITAQSGALNFYDSTGNTLSIGADVTGGVTVATGATISGSTNTIVASTNGSERLRIDSSGNVGIRTTSPTRPLTVAAGSGESVNILGVFDTRFANPATVGNSVIAFSDPTSTAGQFSTRLGSVGDSLAFYTNGSNERMRITSTGNVQITNGNLVFSTSGTGIDFSATSDGSGTVTAETLSEYEEGTWTPVLASLTGGTQPVVTTSVANGLYTRIGRMVYIEFLMVVTAVTTQGTGNIGVTGLPFTSSGNAYGNNIGITYNDIWDTAWREMYVTGSSLQMIPLGVTQSNAYYGTPANNSQSQISTGYFSVAGWYMRS